MSNTCQILAKKVLLILVYYHYIITSIWTLKRHCNILGLFRAKQLTDLDFFSYICDFNLGNLEFFSPIITPHLGFIFLFFFFFSFLPFNGVNTSYYENLLSMAKQFAFLIHTWATSQTSVCQIIK